MPVAARQACFRDLIQLSVLPHLQPESRHDAASPSQCCCSTTQTYCCLELLMLLMLVSSSLLPRQAVQCCNDRGTCNLVGAAAAEPPESRQRCCLPCGLTVCCRRSGVL